MGEREKGRKMATEQRHGVWEENCLPNIYIGSAR